MTFNPAITVKVNNIHAQIERCGLLYGPGFGSWAKWFVQSLCRLSDGEREKLKELLG